MTPRRSAVALVTVLVAAALSAALSAAPARAGDGRDGCGDGVTVVVDGNELGGDLRTGCAPAPGTAAELFVESGFPLEYQPQLQDFVCKVAGLPSDRRCTDGDSYWSLWWAAPGGEWVYSTLGVSSLEVPAGGWLGFAWHEGDGEAAPPDIEVGAGPVSSEQAPPPPSGASTDEDDALPVGILGGVAVLALGTTALVAWRRRRSG
jgi:hypothetical protein